MNANCPAPFLDNLPANQIFMSVDFGGEAGEAETNPHRTSRMPENWTHNLLPAPCCDSKRDEQQIPVVPASSAGVSFH